MLRLHSGLLSAPEAKAVNYLVRRVPRRIAPDHLTAVALFGAILASVSLIGYQFSTWCLPPFLSGLIFNWLGDSLDGALARYRGTERDGSGFMIDRSCDMLCFSIVIICMGQSSFLSPNASFMLLIGYLTNANYGLMRAVVDRQSLIGFGGIGATEGRIAIALWVIALKTLHMDLSLYQFAGVPIFELFCWSSLMGVFAVFVRRVFADIHRFQTIDGERVLWRGEPTSDSISKSLLR